MKGIWLDDDVEDPSHGMAVSPVRAVDFLSAASVISPSHDLQMDFVVKDPGVPMSYLQRFGS